MYGDWGRRAKQLGLSNRGLSSSNRASQIGTGEDIITVAGAKSQAIRIK